jgi:hypothetical protein
MSHDREHQKLEAKLDQLARFLGAEWVPCPEQASEKNDWQGACKDGVYTWNRDHPCNSCLGASQVLKRIGQQIGRP